MKKTILSISIVFTMICAVLLGGYVFAAEQGSKSYSFRIQAYQANSTTSYSLYRDVAANDSTKPWYVTMTSSGEGAGSVTTYFLELSDGTNVSRDVDVKVGNEYHPSAYNTANSKNVYLTAENNNYNSNMYSVSGYWKAKSAY